MPTSTIRQQRGIGYLVGAALLSVTTPAMAQVAGAPASTAGIANLATDGLFQVDQRNPVDNLTGSFFSGLPLPALGYSVRGSVLGTYESNFLRLPDGAPVPAGAHKSNYRVTPLISGDINMPLGRQSLYASATLGKDFYVYDTGYEKQRILLGAGANLAAGSSCTGNISANWIQQQSNNNSTPLNVPNTQTTASYGASASCGGLSGFSPTFSYRHTSSSNAAVTRDLYDLDSDSFSLSVGYARPSFGVVSVFGTLSENRYPNQTFIIGTESFTRGVNVTNFGVRYQRDIGSRLRASASLSQVNIKPKDSLQPDQSGLGYGLTLDYTPAARYSVGVSASRNASSSPNSSALYFIQQAFAIRANYNFGSSLSATASASTSLRDYEGVVPIPGVTQLLSDRLNRFRLSINWVPMRNANVSAYIAQTNRNADPSVYNYNSTSVGLKLAYGI